MAKNRLKIQSEKTEAEAPKGSVFTNINVQAYYLFDNMPFIFYCALLGVMYIANSHYAVRTVKEVKIIQEELKRISWESNSRKSTLMFESMQANVAKKVQHLGLRELQREQPKKIRINP